MRRQCVQSCIYTGACRCEYCRTSKQSTLPHRSEPRKGGLWHPLGYPVLKSLHHVDSPGPAWVLRPHTRSGTSEQRGTGMRTHDSHQGRAAGSEKGALRTHQQRQSHVLCPSGQALTTQAPDTPRTLKTWCAELADVWVPDCPLLGRNRRTHVSQGLHSDSSGGQFPFISGGSMDLVEQKSAGTLPLCPSAWNLQHLQATEMRYNRRTKNQQQKLPAGHTEGARRDEPARFVHLSLLFMLSRVVGCCLLVVTISQAPGTGGPAQPAPWGHPRCCPLPRHVPRHQAASTAPWRGTAKSATQSRGTVPALPSRQSKQLWRLHYF